MASAIITDEFIRSLQSSRGGWSRESLSLLGVKWPPPKGWRKCITGKAKRISTRKAKYLRYLQSGHWKRLRREAFKRDNYRCVKCGSTSCLQGHHIRYRKDLYNCTVDDIETLCQSCHELLHSKKKLTRKGRRAWRKLLSLPDLMFTPLTLPPL